MRNSDAFVAQSLMLLVLIMIITFCMIAGMPEPKQKQVIPCTTDTDCAIKNPQFCGGPYEPACK